MRRIFIDQAQLPNVAAFHDFVAEVLHFPPYYGRNFAALNDCLGDISEPTMVVLHRSPAAAYAGVDLAVDTENRAMHAADNADVRGITPWFEKVCRVFRRASRENVFLEVIVQGEEPPMLDW